MAEYNPEQRVAPMAEDFWVNLQGGEEILLSKSTAELLNESPAEWHDLFIMARESLGLPDFYGHCELVGVTVHPFSRLNPRTAAIALTGVYDVHADIKISKEDILHITSAYEEKMPIVFDIDTHGGNFSYFSGILEHDQRTIFEFSEVLSVQVAHIMSDYYRSIPRSGLNGL